MHDADGEARRERLLLGSQGMCGYAIYAHGEQWDGVLYRRRARAEGALHRAGDLLRAVALVHVSGALHGQRLGRSTGPLLGPEGRVVQLPIHPARRPERDRLRQLAGRSLHAKPVSANCHVRRGG